VHNGERRHAFRSFSFECADTCREYAIPLARESQRRSRVTKSRTVARFPQGPAQSWRKNERHARADPRSRSFFAFSLYTLRNTSASCAIAFSRDWFLETTSLKNDAAAARCFRGKIQADRDVVRQEELGRADRETRKSRRVLSRTRAFISSWRLCRLPRRGACRGAPTRFNDRISECDLARPWKTGCREADREVSHCGEVEAEVEDRSLAAKSSKSTSTLR